VRRDAFGYNCDAFLFSLTWRQLERARCKHSNAPSCAVDDSLWTARWPLLLPPRRRAWPCQFDPSPARQHVTLRAADARNATEAGSSTRCCHSLCAPNLPVGRFYPVFLLYVVARALLAGAE